MKGLICLILLIALSACGTNPDAITPESTQTTCFGFVVERGALTCEPSENSVLVQSDLEDGAVISTEILSITVQGTMNLTQTDETVTFSILEGSSVINIGGFSRVLQAGSRLQLNIVDGEPQRPADTDTGEALLADDLTGIPLENLPRAIQTPIPEDHIAEPTEPTGTMTLDIPEITPSTTIHATSGSICEPRADWQRTYTIKAGDVLALVAEQFDTTVLAIARANCLINPGRLSIGQVLAVPGDAPTLTPSAIAFRADKTALAPGECTMLRWDVFNIKAVFIHDEEVGSSDVLRVCPEATSTYTLRVVYPDDADATRTITITISE